MLPKPLDVVSKYPKYRQNMEKGLHNKTKIICENTWQKALKVINFIQWLALKQKEC